MRDIRKPHRYQIPDNFQPKSDKVIAQNIINKKGLNDSQNKSYSNQVNECQSKSHMSPMISSLASQKLTGSRPMKKSKHLDTHNRPPNQLEVQHQNNKSQETIKLKSKQKGSTQKNIETAKNRVFYYKSPEWLKHKKNTETGQNYFKHEAINKFQAIDQDFHTTAGTNADMNDVTRLRSDSVAYLRMGEENNSDKSMKGRLYYEQKFHIGGEELEITNLRLEEEVKQLKYRLQNMQEDNNILLGRMQTLEVELNLSYKRIGEHVAREQHHRLVEAKLKQKVQDLQSKLLTVKDQINCKNQFLDSGFNEGLSYTLNNDREIIQKKNEEISRLNEIVNKSRLKVNQLNHLLSQQRINSLQHTRALQQHYQSLMLTRQLNSYELKKTIEGSKQKSRFAPSVSVRYLHDNHEMIKKAVSTNNLHRDIPNVKFING